MDLCASDVQKGASSNELQPSHAALSPPAFLSDPALKAWEANQTNSSYPRNLCLHEALSLAAQANPDKVAVEFRDKCVTYKELDERSNQLAHFLQRKGIGPESLVGLCVDRSLEIVVALLGIMKAG